MRVWFTKWLIKQVIWQIYLPKPRHIPRPTFNIIKVNSVHQADLLFLPHDKVGQKVYKYALTVVDVASRYKAAEPLSSKEGIEVAKALIKIYKGPLQWPEILQVDSGSEFRGEVGKEMKKHGVRIRRGNANIHRDQAIVDRFNRSLGEKLDGYHYGKEIDSKGKFSTRNRYNKWVKILPEVVKSLNNEVTRMIGKNLLML